MERFINELPTSISEAYDHMLKRCPEPKTASKIFHIILTTVRPLTLREMNMAVNIEGGQTSREEVDLDPIDKFAAQIRNICGLLVFVSASQEDSNIYLIHQTAKEFLIGRESIVQAVDSDDSSSGTWEHSMDPAVSNRILTQICFDYLSFTAFETEPLRSEPERVNNRETRISHLGISEYEENHELLEYAATRWPFHFRHARMDNALLTRWASLCKPGTARFDTWFYIYRSREKLNHAYNSTYYDPQLPHLVLASVLGHSVIVEQLTNEEKPELRGRSARTALWWAAMNGHESVVRQILEKGLCGPPMFQVVLHVYSPKINTLTEYGALVDQGGARLLGGIRRPMEESKAILDMLIAHGADIDRITEMPTF